MAGFIIAYVPTVETVLEVENVQNVQSVDLVDKVTLVETVDLVKRVNDVDTVHDVRKLPSPYFPLKKLNSQIGGKLHVTANMSTFSATYYPEVDCEFKGVDLCFTSYNIEDTYDVLVGSRFVIKNSSVKEMSEYRRFETYELVPAGTPLTIHFHNNSGAEKFLLYDMINVVDVDVNYPVPYPWTFDWVDSTLNLDEGDTMTLVIAQPDFVNLDLIISGFTLTVRDMLSQDNVATISYSGGNVSSTFSESGRFARVNVIAIIDVKRYAQAIHIIFKNINTTGTSNHHPIEIGINGAIQST